MTDTDFLDLRNALDLLKSRFNVKAIILNDDTNTIDDKIAQCYNEEQIPVGKTLLCGVEIIGLKRNQA